MMDLKKEIVKWVIVILTLLFIPYGSVLLVLACTLLFFNGKIYNMDLLILYFLLFFIQSVSGGTGDSGLGNIRFLLIFIGFFKMVGQKGFSYSILSTNPLYFPVLFVFLIAHSVIFSINMANSLVELISFITLFLFAFRNTYFENTQHRARIFNNIEAMYIAVIVLSIISFSMPSIAYARNGVGFQGIGNHPNAFGVVLAPYCGWVLLRLFQNFTRKDLILAIVSVLLLYLSQSRTSLLSVLLGIFSLVLIYERFRRLLSKGMIIVTILILPIVVFYTDSIGASIFRYLDKSNTGSIEESVLLSRGSIIEKQTTNINDNLFFGIGFKTPSSLIVDNAFSIGKPYEKGNMILAGIEELGVIGFLVFLVTIISILRLRANKSSVLIIIPLTALFTTMGEATLFSIGGIGALIWVFIFFAFHNGQLVERITKDRLVQNKKNVPNRSF